MDFSQVIRPYVIKDLYNIYKVIPVIQITLLPDSKSFIVHGQLNFISAFVYYDQTSMLTLHLSNRQNVRS